MHLRQQNLQETFETYVRSNSVLLAPGTHPVDSTARAGQAPWLLYRGGPRRACPARATEPRHGECLIWHLPLMAGRPDHACRLEEAMSIPAAIAVSDQPEPGAIGEPLATLDRYTAAALTTGQVQLPARAVHAGVWVRLLRSLLNEVGLAVTTDSEEQRHRRGSPPAGREPLEQWRLAHRLSGADATAATTAPRDAVARRVSTCPSDVHRLAVLLGRPREIRGSGLVVAG